MHRSRLLLWFCLALAAGFLVVKLFAVSPTQDCPPSAYGGATLSGSYINLTITQVSVLQSGRRNDGCPPYRPCIWLLNAEWDNIDPSVAKICLQATNCFSGERCFSIPADTRINNKEFEVYGKCATRCIYDVVIKDSSDQELERFTSAIVVHCGDCI